MTEHTERDDVVLTRSEERLRVDRELQQSGTATLGKHVVAEEVTQTVPLRHEQARLEREPVAAAAQGDHSFGELREVEQEILLHAERPVVETNTVAVERVALTTEVVTDEHQVDATLRSERIDEDR